MADGGIRFVVASLLLVSVVCVMSVRRRDLYLGNVPARDASGAPSAANSR